MSHLKMGALYRYARPYSVQPEIDDRLPNFFFFTNTDGMTKPLLDKGISPIASVSGPEGKRLLAILLSSSPHRIGTEGTPWQDIFDVDNGTVRYFGDNKSSSAASLSAGNRVLLEQFKYHTSPNPAERKLATPILFFEREVYEGRTKGNVRFQGLGIIQRIELVTQYQKNIGYFTNYVFEFAVLSLAEENEIFDWDWISKRRQSEISLESSIKLAPKSFQNWQKHGQTVIEKERRRVSDLKLVKSSEQLPPPGSREDKALKEIYSFYDGKKHKFELLASRVVSGIISQTGGHYRQGWITRASSDGGVDFVGRLDIGEGFSKVKVVVLGQAKCEKPNSGTSARDLARTVARLKRGWIGAYVTTSFFTERSQIEMIEDEFPLLTVNGKLLSIEVLRQQNEEGFATMHEFLVATESDYDSRISSRRPEEILLD